MGPASERAGLAYQLLGLFFFFFSFVLCVIYIFSPTYSAAVESLLPRWRLVNENMCYMASPQAGQLGGGEACVRKAAAGI